MDPFQGSRVFTNRKQKKAVEEGKVVELANTLRTPDFFAHYCPDTVLSSLRARCTDHDPQIEIMLLDHVSLGSTNLIKKCFRLIEESSADDYKASGVGWSVVRKDREMREPDMRYIVLVTPPARIDSMQGVSSDQTVLGFTSFMVTYEDGYEVVYIYEIHFQPQYRGKGWGKMLMEVVEQVAKRIGVEKIMLTVFNTNQRAVKWYHGLGFETDEFSPEPRTLRNGTVKESTYTILSKRLRPSAS